MEEILLYILSEQHHMMDASVNEKQHPSSPYYQASSRIASSSYASSSINASDNLHLFTYKVYELPERQ
jgi:hypothetical protein